MVQGFVVDKQAEQMMKEEPHRVQYTGSQTRPAQLQAVTFSHQQ